MERRGKYRAKLLLEEGMKPDESALLRAHARWKAKIFKASRIEDPVGKEILAEDLASAMVRLQLWRELEARGGLTSEETKAMPGLVSAVHRLCRDMGLTKSGAASESDGGLVGGRG